MFHLHPSICIERIHVPDPVIVLLDNDEEIEQELDQIDNNPVIRDEETFEVFGAHGFVGTVTYADLRKNVY